MGKLGEQRATEAGARYTAIFGDPADPERLDAELRQAKKMEAIGRLASGVAHDFNNLLMGISGTADIALGELADDHPARPLVTEILAAALSGAEITRQLLAFARERDLTPTCVDLGALLLASRRFLARLLGEDIELVVEAPEGPAWVLCDTGQLEQVLMNLTVNARDAMPEGGRLALSLTGVEVGKEKARERGIGRGRFWALTVTDSGTGISEAVQSRMFEPFFTTKDVGQGTGLGLSTVYGIVEQAGGCIEVESRPQQGTRFTLLLPATEPADKPRVERPRRKNRRVTETVLVVEDEPLVREAARYYLERGGYRVLTAGDGDEAARLCESTEAIALILSDVILPGARGPAVARKIAQSRPSIRVLFMSSQSRDMLVGAGRLAPGAVILEKPFQEGQLLEAVGRVLDAPDVQAHPPTAGTLLLVEDHPAAREACRTLLEAEGYEVLAAASGEEARRLVLEHGAPIDVAILDFSLPGLVGGALAEEIEGLAHLSGVVYVSGLSGEEPQIRALLDRSGASFLQKPFRFEELAAVVREALARASRPAEE